MNCLIVIPIFPSSNIPSGSGASPASHRRLSSLRVNLEGLLRSHHHDNQSNCRGSFQVSELTSSSLQLSQTLSVRSNSDVLCSCVCFQEREGEDGLLLPPGE